ncbi:MAG TPA: hypothetical protein VEC60_11225 [Reyranella sp.]|nr:hypothetical protein [Reyranella sp.]
MLDHGHPDARRYPLGVLWDESRLVVERMNGEMATHLSLLQLAVGSVLSKKAGDLFNKQIKALTGD